MIPFKHLIILASVCVSAMATMHPAIATPVIGIGNMYEVLKPQTQSITKRIYNTGDSTAFVRVELFEINPEKTNQTESPQKELSGNTLKQDRLIVTPQRLIIPPNGFQAVRILWPNERQKEHYFRVRFIPVMPETDDGFGLDKEQKDKYRQETLTAGLNVLTGYGTVVIVEPDNPRFNSQVNALSSGDIIIKNSGNATIALDNIRHCKAVNIDCGETTREFILPNRSKTIFKKAGYKINFTLIEGNSSRVFSY